MKRFLVFCFLFLSAASYGAALNGYDAIYEEFPRDSYLVGIGEIDSSGNTLKDRRTVEVLARLEIAKQVRVRVKEETIDIMCEGGKTRLFSDGSECRDEVFMVIESSVDEFLQGSRIVKQGKREGIVFAVAVMPRGEIVKELDERTDESIDKAKDYIEKSKGGDPRALKKAEGEYMKAVVYDKEKEVIQGVRDRADKVFEDLEKEIVKLKGTD